MENAKKNLKVASWLVLALAAFTVVRKVVDAVINGFEVKEVPADMTEDLVRISLIVAFSFGFVVILPQLYIAIKGFKIANAPCHAKGHIIWATILLVIALIGVFAPIPSLIKADHIGSNLAELSNALLNVVIYSAFLSAAFKVKKEIR